MWRTCRLALGREPRASHRHLNQFAPAMLHVVFDKFALGVGDGVFDGEELLHRVKAPTVLLHHGDNRSQMTAGSFEAFDGIGG